MDLATAIADTTRFERLIHVARCTSTQDLAMQDEQPGCAIYWADHQSHGRGREGRTWHDSPAQDIAVSFRLTGVHLDNPTHLAAAIPVAAIRSIAEVAPAARIKWPNDLLVGGRKLCGVLIDSPGQPGQHVIGVGMNINRSAFPAELRETSTSLALLTGREFDRAERVLALATAIDGVVTELASGQLEGLAAEFREHLGLNGRPVTATTADATTTGRLTAMDLDRIVLDARTEIHLAHLRRLAAR